LTPEAAEAASLVILFDEINRNALFDRYPSLRTPVINLGEVAGLGNIPDPVDGDLAQFQSVYDQIADAIAELASLLRSSNSNEVWPYETGNQRAFVHQGHRRGRR
jgi:protein-tyrosine-phosphatase